MGSSPTSCSAVLATELERDVLAFIAERYADRHLGIEDAQLGLSMVNLDIGPDARTDEGCT
jgi:hypothetical protein